MRAKMEVTGIEEFKSAEGEVTSERLTMRAVYKNGYTADGLDEDNTYAKFTPQADVAISIANSALFGHFKAGDKYYVDFTKVD